MKKSLKLPPIEVIDVSPTPCQVDSVPFWAAEGQVRCDKHDTEEFRSAYFWSLSYALMDFLIERGCYANNMLNVATACIRECGEWIVAAFIALGYNYRVSDKKWIRS